MSAVIAGPEEGAVLAEGWSDNWLSGMPLIVPTVLARSFGQIEFRAWSRSHEECQIGEGSGPAKFRQLQEMKDSTD